MELSNKNSYLGVLINFCIWTYFGQNFSQLLVILKNENTTYVTKPSLISRRSTTLSMEIILGLITIDGKSY